MSEQTPDQTAERINQLEEQIAHLTRAVDDMSEIVTRQEDEIVTLNRRVHMLMQREGNGMLRAVARSSWAMNGPRITKRQSRSVPATRSIR